MQYTVLILFATTTTLKLLLIIINKLNYSYMSTWLTSKLINSNLTEYITGPD